MPWGTYGGRRWWHGMQKWHPNAGGSRQRAAGHRLSVTSTAAYHMRGARSRRVTQWRARALVAAVALRYGSINGWLAMANNPIQTSPVEGALPVACAAEYGVMREDNFELRGTVGRRGW